METLGRKRRFSFTYIFSDLFAFSSSTAGILQLQYYLGYYCRISLFFIYPYVPILGPSEPHSGRIATYHSGHGEMITMFNGEPALRSGKRARRCCSSRSSLVNPKIFRLHHPMQ